MEWSTVFGKTMASHWSAESSVKVGENREFADDYSSSNSEADAGEGTKRRRVTHDYRKLSKLGYNTSVSSSPKPQSSSEPKGTYYSYLLKFLLPLSSADLIQALFSSRNLIMLLEALIILVANG